MRRVPGPLRRRHRLPAGFVTLGFLLVLALVAVLAPVLWGDTAGALDTVHARQGTSPDHWLGTDDLGRDVLARTLVATRRSLLMALAAAGIAAGSGFVLGCVAAVLRGRLRDAVMGALHWALAFPPVIMALFVSAIVGPGSTGAVLAIGVALAPSFARIAQTLAVQVAESEYVAAARTVGVGRRHIVTRYLMPNIAEPVIIQGAITVGISLVSISALSFLGLGVQPPAFDWGRMLAEGLDKIFTVPVVALAPATAIVISGMTFSHLGDILARRLQGTENLRSTRRRSTPRVVRRVPAAAENRASDRADAGAEILRAEDLTVRFDTQAGEATVVDGVDLSVSRGERVGIVGESGSGKTMTALALARLLPDNARVTATRLEFQGNDLLDQSPRALRRLLGLDLAMVFQDPGSSMNPMLRVGRQLTEASQVHRGMTMRLAVDQAVAKLREVHIPAPERRLTQYPHEFSGGMRQRAMIAMGLMGQPSLLIADEPTTALDVTVQAHILDVLREVNQRDGATVLLITHDVGVVAEFCQRVVVMYAGQVVEDTDVRTLLQHARHPYSRALVAAVPDLGTDARRTLATIPGSPPDSTDSRDGCPFAARCTFAVDACGERPVLETVRPGHRVACWRSGEMPDLHAERDEEVVS